LATSWGFYFLRNYAGKQKRNQSPTYTMSRKPTRRTLAQEAMCVARAVANAAQEAEEEEEKEREQTQTAAQKAPLDERQRVRMGGEGDQYP